MKKIKKKAQKTEEQIQQERRDIIAADLEDMANRVRAGDLEAFVFAATTPKETFFGVHHESLLGLSMAALHLGHLSRMIAERIFGESEPVDSGLSGLLPKVFN